MSDKTPFRITDRKDGHEWGYWQSKAFRQIECCRICGIVRRADDKNAPCKGPCQVATRNEGEMSESKDTPMERLQAYWYCFDPTGVKIVDHILSAVACAGKSFHSTELWMEDAVTPSYHEGPTPLDWIINAAKKAAIEHEANEQRITDLEAAVRVMREAVADRAKRWCCWCGYGRNLDELKCGRCGNPTSLNWEADLLLHPAVVKIGEVK